MLLEINGEITPERMKGWSQSKNNTQLWMRLVIEARSDAVKSNSNLQTLETQDHPAVFETAFKYCTLDSFVDHDGYSISSEGFLPAVVDIMVI